MKMQIPRFKPVAEATLNHRKGGLASSLCNVEIQGACHYPERAFGNSIPAATSSTPAAGNAGAALTLELGSVAATISPGPLPRHANSQHFEQRRRSVTPMANPIA